MSDSDQTIRDLLMSIADELHYENCHIQLQATSTNGANFSSKLYEATISAPDKPDVELFAKFGIIGEETRAVVNMDIYSREFVFYNEVMNVYKCMEEKHNIPERDRLCLAKYYGCNKEYLKESIVLENLLKKDFECYDRLKSVDWVYARESVKQLAVLHASSIAYAQEYPQKFAEITKGLDFVYPKTFIEKAVDNALAAAKEDYRERFSIFLKENLKGDNYERFFKPGRITVMIDGDYRPSNLMHRVLENGELEVAILDFQTFQVDPEDVPSIENSLERVDQGVKPSALFAERLNGIISDYIRMGVL
ncbi:unnamed protein product, partial [Iphiclides podalirius]